LRVDIPVPIDSDHLIWSAFHNEYWPADYFIDRSGRIRYHHFGAGEYDKSERVLQTLLRESGTVGLPANLVSISADGVEAPPSGDVQSPETYIGYRRVERFESPGRLVQDSPRIYSPPESTSLNEWGLSGSWNVGDESAVSQAASAKMVFRFHSRDLHMVLGPATPGKPVRFKVRLDGAAPGDDCGVDSTPNGAGEVREPRLYQLVRQKGKIGDRTFEIEFLEPDVPAFSLTFG
jgi:hypothetical protein